MLIIQKDSAPRPLMEQLGKKRSLPTGDPTPWDVGLKLLTAIFATVWTESREKEVKKGEIVLRGGITYSLALAEARGTSSLSS